MELVTGRLTQEQYEDEVTAIANFMIACDVAVVEVTYGSGCDFDQVNPLEPVPVAPALLASFIDELTERGVYELAWNDLFLKAVGHGLAVLLCEASDIHVYADTPATIQDIRDRWTIMYADAHEVDRASQRWRPLCGGPWRLFDSENADPQRHG